MFSIFFPRCRIFIHILRAERDVNEYISQKNNIYKNLNALNYLFIINKIVLLDIIILYVTKFYDCK